MSDSSGYHAVLADVPKGQLSERQHRIATALAMVRDGKSINGAAKECGIPYSTLYNHTKGLTNPDYEKSFQAGERELIDGMLSIASLASEKIFERVEADTMKDGDLIKAQGVATDKIAAYRNWAKGSSGEANDMGMSAVAQLLQKGMEAAIKEADPVAQAIEVEGSSS